MKLDLLVTCEDCGKDHVIHLSRERYNAARQARKPWLCWNCQRKGALPPERSPFDYIEEVQRAKKTSLDGDREKPAD